MKIKAYGKLNLFLKVIDKKDNYHQLEMVNVLINLHDVLVIKKTKESIKFWCSEESLNNSNNIVYLVTKKIFNDFKIETGVDIKLFKHIPLESGLGGESTDAANTILALDQLFRLNMSFNYYRNISLEFGYDIMFFLKKMKIAKVLDDGTNVIPINLPYKQIFTLIIPDFKVNTKEFFSQYKIVRSDYTIDDFIQKNVLHNDLMTNHPYIDEYKKIEETIKEKIYLTGSGSCVYSIGNINIYKKYKSIKVKTI